MSEEIISKSFGIPSMKDLNGTPIEDENIDEAEIEDTVATVVSDDALEIVESPQFNPSSTTMSDADDEYEKDIDKAKKNVGNVMHHGYVAFEELVVLAGQTENPRAYEVAANLMKTIVDANKEYVELSDKKRKLKSITSPSTVNNTINNNLVLTTNDLLRMIKRTTEE